MFKMQLRGVEKQLSHCPTRAGILTPNVLLRCHRKVNFSQSFQTAVWAVFCIAFFSFARLANLVPRTRRLFDAARQLTRSDIILTSDTLLLNFKWTKTLQDGSRIISIPLAKMSHSPLCPVSAYQKLLSQVTIPSHMSAFCYLSNGRITTLTAHQVVTVLRALTREIGLNNKKYSGHSFRRSGATWAFKAGVRSEAIKTQGDWRSLAYLNYIEITPEQKRQVSTQMANAITLFAQ
jgi:integrase